MKKINKTNVIDARQLFEDKKGWNTILRRCMIALKQEKMNRQVDRLFKDIEKDK